MRDLRHELANAGDDKIRRIVAMTDQQALPRAAQALLDPLRPRLAVLRPLRPLRFARLLFMPLDPVIVPPADWRPGEASVPRSAIPTIADAVRSGLGARADDVETAIAGFNTADAAIVARAGAMLWPEAGCFLADSPVPPGWDATGMKPAAYTPLARGIGAVLTRAVRLWEMNGDALRGLAEPADETLRDMLAGLATHSMEGHGMVVTLLLSRLPHAAAQLHRMIANHRGTADTAHLRQATDRGLDIVLTHMEKPATFAGAIRDAPLRDVRHEVQRFSSLLAAIDDEPDAARHRPRIKAVRASLDQACRTRFGKGLDASLIGPLAATGGSLAGTVQTEIENSVRDLRALEVAARRIGGGGTYDALLAKAGEALKIATASGGLTPIRHMRLVEILAGPEAAEALYPAMFSAP